MAVEPVVSSLGDDSEWNDTNNDVKDMHRLGKKQEFKRNFGFISTLGFVTVCMYTPTWPNTTLAPNKN
jgi:choline transport protein